MPSNRQSEEFYRGGVAGEPRDNSPDYLQVLNPFRLQLRVVGHVPRTLQAGDGFVKDAQLVVERADPVGRSYGGVAIAHVPEVPRPLRPLGARVAQARS
jgi:hypothetical protein